MLPFSNLQAHILYKITAHEARPRWILLMKPWVCHPRQIWYVSVPTNSYVSLFFSAGAMSEARHHRVYIRMEGRG